MAEPARQTFSFEAYLELEEVSPVKHEFLAGQVWAMASLEEIVLVVHDEQRVEVCRRTPEGWTQHSVGGGSIHLHSIDAELPLTEIYRNPFGDAA